MCFAINGCESTVQSPVPNALKLKKIHLVSLITGNSGCVPAMEPIDPWWRSYRVFPNRSRPSARRPPSWKVQKLWWSESISNGLPTNRESAPISPRSWLGKSPRHRSANWNWRIETQNATSDESLPMWLPILLACLLGLVSAVVVMWRTSVSAKRARELRMSHRGEPDAFLQDLGESEHHHSPSFEDQ